MTELQGRRYWLIGASQGIGRAVALELHGRGAALILSARDGAALEVLARELGSRVEVRELDVTDADRLALVASELMLDGEGVDTVIYLAALYQPMQLDQLDLEQTAQMLQVNLLGAFHLVAAIYPAMKDRGRGQIVLCGSVAGYRGLPAGQPYAATKAGLISLAESLYLEARDSGVDVRLVSPGFVRTRLTEKNRFAMPFLLEPEVAARRLVDGILSSRFEIRFPRLFALGLRLLAILPRSLYFWLLSRNR